MKRSTMTHEIMKMYSKKRRFAEARRDEKVSAIYQYYPSLAEIEAQMTRKSISITRGLLADPEDHERLLNQLNEELDSLKKKAAGFDEASWY